MNSSVPRDIAKHLESLAGALSVKSPDHEHSPDIRRHLRTRAAVSRAVSADRRRRDRRAGFARLLGLVLVALLVMGTGLAQHDDVPMHPDHQETVR